jgi:hypothetical protein
MFPMNERWGKARIYQVGRRSVEQAVLSDRALQDDVEEPIWQYMRQWRALAFRRS